jgi:hypothetical protein
LVFVSECEEKFATGVCGLEFTWLIF